MDTSDFVDGGWSRVMDELAPRVKDELVGAMLGEYLGRGIDRAVFRSRLDPTKVVKLQVGGGDQNVCESIVWQSLAWAPTHAKWLAPVRWISSYGSVLIQDYCEPIPRHMLPEKLPTWMTDNQQKNWGLLNGKPVCHDYGTTISRIIGLGTPNRTRSADWWLDDE